MENRNGYFQLLVKSNGTYIKLFAPKGEGKPILYDDISNYLTYKKLYEYDKITLGRALANLQSEDVREVKLSPLVILSQDEYLEITVSEDRMTVIGRLYYPVDDGSFLTKEEIVRTLINNGVKYGIDEEKVDELLKDKHYCTDYILAKGTPAIQGSDAQITYHFNTDLNRKPKRNEDGTVDFHKLDIICKCMKDQLLASLIPADPGKEGMDAYGNIIRPSKVSRKSLRHGNKAYLSDDGLKMFSLVDGHVALIDGRVFVSDTYEISGNVDASTGDVDYDGNVFIRGSVLTGYSVYAHGDIEISGAVEGAYIEAGGQIILRRGMQGMNKGVLKAQGNIVTRFLENAQVIAGGYVSSDSILHSNVSAKGDVIVGGRRGYVTGGVIRSGSLISVKTAGSQMGTSTVLEVGIDPHLLEKFKIVEKNIAELQEEKDKIAKALELFKRGLASNSQVTKDKIDDLKRISKHNINIDSQLAESREKYKKIMTTMEGNTAGMIAVYDKIYPGTTLAISNITYHVKEVHQHCKFVRDKADIKSIPF